jgi:hypothetical protein
MSTNINKIISQIKKIFQTQDSNPKSKLQTITFDEFKKFEEQDPYYKGRWPYFKKVNSIIKKLSISNALELGPYKRPIIHNSDVMDRDDNYFNLTYHHDASQSPWPIEDSKYDLFIALQVWEHLDGSQKEAFKEVMRISKMAILSFPLNWNCPGDCHHGITEKQIAEWTLHVKPVKKIKIKGGQARIIYLFKFKSS